MIRKRRDADGFRRGAMGIDDDKSGRITKSGITSHLGQDTQTCDSDERSYSPNAKRHRGDQWLEVGKTEQPLRQVDDFQFRTKSRDIFNNVEANSNGGFSGPVKYGTDLDN